MLASRWSEAELVNACAAATWNPFPRAAERSPWEDLQRHPLRFRQASWLLGRAEGRLGSPWAPLPAQLMMRFAADGNRSEFEAAYYRRRHRLAHAVLAECMEYHGRFLPEIIDGLWLISEEGSWCLPAHYGMFPGSTAWPSLPPADQPVLDIFAAESGMVLAEAMYLLEAELQALAPELLPRLRRHLRHRVLDPFTQRDDWWWMDGRNNWTPWIVSNVVGVACHLDLPVAELAAIAHRGMVICDRWFATYHDDGACDEGAMYWNVATGAAAMLIEHLFERSGGLVNPYDDPKLRAMACYPLTMHIGWQWFANFADCGPTVPLGRAVLTRLGQRLGDEELSNLAQLAMRGYDPMAPVDPPLSGSTAAHLNHMLRELWWIDPHAQASPTLRHDRDRWLGDVQVLVAHEHPEDAVGLVLAAKAGHNDENHNHNDVGHFIVMLDGVPALVDMGCASYTAATFGSGRYDLLWNGAQGHAVPQINGYLQAAGAAHAARGVRHLAEQHRAVLECDLAPCYPAEAGVSLAERRLELHRGDNPRVELHDRVVLRQGPVALELPLYTPREVTELQPGRWSIDCGGRALLISVDAQRVSGSIETVPLDDPLLRNSWGPQLYRLRLRCSGKGSECSLRVAIRADGEV